MSWKVALYDFIHNRNQAEVDYRWETLASVVTDPMYLAKERARLERRKEREQERRLEPVRAETRLKVRSAEVTPEGAVSAIAELRRMMELRVNGKTDCEEVVEVERVLLVPKGTGYQVSRVEPLKEEAPGLSSSPDSEPFSLPNESDLRPGAGPLLNRSLVTPSGEFDDQRRIPYNREKARQYADRWWDSYNPEFLHFDVDCSNFVSQCLFAGGAPMNYTGKRESGWWYRGRSGSQELWSFSWAVANALRLYLSHSRAGLRAEQVESPKQLAIGDVIAYSWDGDGRFGHSTVVTGFDGNGMPLVNAHTVNSRNRYWDYKDSYAWTERTMYRFFHIPDFL